MIHQTLNVYRSGCGDRGRACDPGSRVGQEEGRGVLQKQIRLVGIVVYNVYVLYMTMYGVMYANNKQFVIVLYF